jgi:hypothetical protein
MSAVVAVKSSMDLRARSHDHKWPLRHGSSAVGVRADRNDFIAGFSFGPQYGADATRYGIASDAAKAGLIKDMQPTLLRQW